MSLLIFTLINPGEINSILSTSSFPELFILSTIVDAISIGGFPISFEFIIG